ncbi:MAG TPA: hypothetical protein DEG47_27805, partial [Cyanobacteria bacterium UBA11148]|nr:hypothetical protein [Cyanobacteria bacterium UBA11148]
MTAVTSRHFTLAEYHRLGELGFFGADERVELIRGEIIQMPTKKTPHSVCNTRLIRQLILLLGEQAIARGQEPIILPADSEPQPDAVIARYRSDDYLSSHPQPADILLVIEISDSTLNYDQQTKLSLYAEDGIADYWIFNLVENHLETYCEPYQDTQGKFNYRSKRIFLPN